MFGDIKGTHPRCLRLRQMGAVLLHQSIARMRFFAFLVFLFASHSSFAMSEQRVGYYPGSFDPLTSMHKTIIYESVRQLNLDKIYILVNTVTSKDYRASISERMEMISRSTADLKERGIEVVAVAQPYGGDLGFVEQISQESRFGLFGIFGADVFDSSFLEYSHISSMRFVRAPRAGELASAHGRQGFVSLHLEASAVSSSRVREEIAHGAGLEELQVPRETWDFIWERGLYSEPRGRVLTDKLSFFKLRAHMFIQALKRESPELSLPELTYTFTASQSVEGHNDHLIRRVIRLNGLSGPAAIRFRESALRILSRVEFEKLHENFRKLQARRFNGTFGAERCSDLF